MGSIGYYRLGSSYPRTGLRKQYAQKKVVINARLLVPTGPATHNTYNETGSGGAVSGGASIYRVLKNPTLGGGGVLVGSTARPGVRFYPIKATTGGEAEARPSSMP